MANHYADKRDIPKTIMLDAKTKMRLEKHCAKPSINMPSATWIVQLIKQTIFKT